MRTVHIYAISLSDGRAYVGSTFNPEQRAKAHFALLRRNAHHSPRLQNAWNKYGEAAFSFAVLETAECANLAERTALEAKWAALHGALNTARSTNGITFDKSPRFMRQLRDRLKEYHSDPANRMKMGEWSRTDEGRAWLIARNKEWWSDERNRERMRQMAKERCTPEFMAMCRANGAARQTEAVQKQRRESMTQRMADPAERLRMAEIARQTRIRLGIENVERAVRDKQPFTRSLFLTGQKHLARLSPEAARVVTLLVDRSRYPRVRAASGRYQSQAYPGPFDGQLSEG